MKFLAISDQVDPMLYQRFQPSFFRGVEFVVSCGDLPKYYLEFIIDALNVPCYYVHGNHDALLGENPPMGWQCLDGKVLKRHGIRIMGLGGSKKYNRESPFQFTEWEMKTRYWKMAPRLLFDRKIDLLVTHSPAYETGDLPLSRVHAGFKVFREILQRHSPGLFLYGHVHLNYGVPAQADFKGIPSLNAYRFRIVEHDFGSV